MGGDGGVIAVKRKFIKECRTEDKHDSFDPREAQLTKATTCALTGQELVEPIVCCKLGYLFNKEAILSALIDKSLPSTLSHITGLKAIKTLKMTPNPDKSSTESTKFVCPITQVPLNGVNPFVAIWSTGYVLTEKSIRELGIISLQSEYGPFREDDIIRLLPSEEEFIQRRARIQAEQEVAQRKSKKKKRTQESLYESGDASIESLNSSAEVHSQKKLCTSGTTISTQQVLDTAQSKNHLQEERSQVYQKLFHKDSGEKTSQRDLFMSIGGLRYTLS